MDVYQEHGSSIGTLARMVEALKKGGNFQVSGFAQTCKNHLVLILYLSLSPYECESDYVSLHLAYPHAIPIMA